MGKGVVLLTLVGLVWPPLLRAEGVAIEHSAVGCVVAGKFPRLRACFTPASRLARARVYFRVAGAAPDWYYVEMTPDAPCHSGVLPRPKKELVGHRIQLYIDTFDRSFAESRTPEAEALVVSRPADCHARLPVAPVLDSATVAVFPSLPAGFAVAAGGLGAEVTAALAVGGAAVVGGGVALATGGGSESPGGIASPASLPPPETLPPLTTTTTTTTLAVGFVPVFKVFRGATLETGSTIVGTEPLPLRFDMCETTGPYPLRFAVEVDGVQMTSRCSSSITFTTTSASPDVAGAGVHRSSSPRTYAVNMDIHSAGPNNRPRASHALTVQVNPSGSTGCTGDSQGPLVTLTRPLAGAAYPSPDPYPVHLEASADDSTKGDNGVAFVEYKLNYPGPDELILGPLTGGSPWPYDWTQSAVNAYLGGGCSRLVDVQAYAQDNCGNSTLSPKIQITIHNTGSCTPPDRGAAAATGTVVSELGVPGGAGQVVANGEAAFPRAGRTPFAVRAKPGENRIEATLVEARSGGTWRFELGGMAGYQPESLRVIAGDVVQLGADVVTFRLQGRPGERIVFAFRAERE